MPRHLGDTKPASFSSRLRILAKHAGTMAALSRASGVKDNTLRMILKRGNAPDGNICAALIRGTGCDARWLLTGEGKAFPERAPLATIKTLITGGGMDWQVSEDLKPYDTTVPGDLIAFEVRGDSMQPLALDGQVVLALRDVRPADGDLAVIELKDGTHSFKRIHIHDEQWILMPVNPTHEPQVCRQREIRRAMKVWGVKF